MKALTTEDLIELGGDRVVGEHRPLGPVAIDSRALPPDSTFFCIRGPRFDGHDFALPAVDAGARVVVCEANAARRVAASLGGRATVIAVIDTVRILGLLASRYRTRFHGTVVGVTGSSGKTTTKELIAAVLQTAGAVHKTAGNLNNHLGLPLTLLGLRPSHTSAVIEMGMSAVGEIAWLAELARPRFGVITTVGAAHLQTLGDVSTVAMAKGELLRALPPNGLGIFPSSVVFPWVLTRGVHSPLMTVGQAPTDEVRLSGAREGRQGAVGMVHVDGRRLRLSLRLSGVHNLVNALLAIAVGRAAGIDPARAIEALGEVAPPSMRGEVRRLRDGTPVVLDCYNANPQSMLASVEAFARKSPHGIAILGDMLELGPGAASAHAAIGRAVARLSPHLALIAVGRHAADMVAAAREGGTVDATTAPDAEAAAGVLRDRKLEGRPILLKGSRGMRLERVYAALTASSAGEGGH